MTASVPAANSAYTLYTMPITVIAMVRVYAPPTMPAPCRIYSQRR
jgi:hypothetical protein